MSDWSGLANGKARLALQWVSKQYYGTLLGRREKAINSPKLRQDSQCNDAVIGHAS
jgi:hypothetical protein